VEVVVASALLVASLVPVLRAMTVSQITARRIARTSQSLMVAQGFLEQLRARAENNYGQSLAVASHPLAEGFLASVTDDAHPLLREVTVSVGYDGDQNQILSPDEIRVVLTTCIARHNESGSL
jgi:hypothetical protein